MELAQGQVIAERYRLERLLGEGGMGAVWSAVHVVTRKPVALKFIKESDAARSPQMRRRFQREARAASAVRHPNVVEVHDIVELADGSPVMVMELLEGESLAERLAREGRLSLKDTARLLVPVISAVGTAHATGVVHRDLKPDNIFLSRAGDGAMEVKVLDFGIAKYTPAELDAQTAGGLTQTGAMLGTPYYMSPEQAFGENDIDHRADIWALGVILYECLAGGRPIEGDNTGQIIKVIVTGGVVPLEKRVPALPRDVTELVAKMLTQKREERLGDLREALALLRRYADVASTSFEGPRVIVAPPSEKKISDSAETVGADPFARTTDASGPQRAASVTAGAHEVQVPAKRASRSWIAIVGAGAVAVIAGGYALNMREAPRASAPSPVTSATSVTVPVTATASVTATATASATTTATVTAPASASAAPTVAIATAHATTKPNPTTQPSATAKSTAAPSASALPGGVYGGQAPF
jgi:eukaryotic-like serine/threonine-protein kinase